METHRFTVNVPNIGATSVPVRLRLDRLAPADVTRLALAAPDDDLEVVSAGISRDPCEPANDRRLDVELEPFTSIDVHVVVVTDPDRTRGGTAAFNLADVRGGRTVGGVVLACVERTAPAPSGQLIHARSPCPVVLAGPVYTVGVGEDPSQPPTDSVIPGEIDVDLVAPITNPTTNALHDVEVYLEHLGLNGGQFIPQTWSVGTLAAGDVFFATWPMRSPATAGVFDVSVVAGSRGKDRVRLGAQIEIGRARRDRDERGSVPSGTGLEQSRAGQWSEWDRHDLGLDRHSGQFTHGATEGESAPRRSGRMNLTRARDLALALGLLLSAGFWLAYVAFYGEFGMTPGDVGIGFGQVLERSIGALVFIVVMSLLIVLLVGYAFVLLTVGLFGPRPGEKPGAVVQFMPTEDGKRQPGDGLWIIGQRAVRAITVVAILLWLVPLVGSTITESNWGAALVILGLLVAFVAGIVRAAWKDWDVAVVDLHRVLDWVGGIAAAVSLAAFALYLFAAQHSAELVKDGKAVRSEELLGLRTSAITAQPSRLRSSAIDPDRCVLYLGASDGVTVVYDPRADLIERLPSGDLRVTIDRDADRCPS